MSISTILAAASGGDATRGAVETGFALARRLGAHVEIFHAGFDERQAIMPMGDGMNAPVSAELIERIIADGKKAQDDARRAFDDAAKRHGLPLRHDAPPPPQAGAAPGPREASADWFTEIGSAPDLIARRARAFDLVVLGRSDRVADQPHSGSIEAAVLESGRPVLLAPGIGMARPRGASRSAGTTRSRRFMRSPHRCRCCARRASSASSPSAPKTRDWARSRSGISPGTALPRARTWCGR